MRSASEPRPSSQSEQSDRGGQSSPPHPARLPRPRPARDRLLAAAARLFYAHGIAATGIDTITAEAGVAKMTLYNNFASKDELVGAYIEARHEEWLGLYGARLAALESSVVAGAGPADVAAGGEFAEPATGGAAAPRDRVLAVFDAYIDHADDAYEYGFRGCGLLNAAAELPAGSAGRDAVRAHKEQVETILRGHLEAMGRDDARRLAEHLSFLLEGAMSRAGLEGASERLEHARRLAAGLIAS